MKIAAIQRASGKASEHVSNTTLAWNLRGKVLARYDKIHLFAFDNGRESYDESRVLEAGRTPTVFELPSRDGHTWGQTLAIDPWGQVLTQQAEGVGVVLADCDWARVQAVVELLPALRHRVF